MGFFNKLFGTEEDNTAIASDVQHAANQHASSKADVVPDETSKDNTKIAAPSGATPSTDGKRAPSLKRPPHLPSAGAHVPERVNVRLQTPTRSPPKAGAQAVPPVSHTTTKATRLGRAAPSSTRSDPQRPSVENEQSSSSGQPAASHSFGSRERNQESTLPGIGLGPEHPAEYERRLKQEGVVIREYLICEGLGPVSSDWTAGISRALQQLASAAATAGQSRDAELFEQTLETVGKGDLAGPKFKQLLADLSNVLPGRFSISDEIASREKLLIDNLIRQIPEVRRPTVDRLKQGRMWSLERLQNLELSQAAKSCGIDNRCLAHIRDLVKQHLKQRKNWHPSPDSRSYKQSLNETLATLEKFEAEFEVADREQDREQKRRAREARRRAALQINLILVESGDLDTLAAVERMSIADRISHLRVANGNG